MRLPSCEKEKKRQNLNFADSPNHTVVNKTTLACTAVCNANTHSEWFIQIDVDQSVTKQAMTASVIVGN